MTISQIKSAAAKQGFEVSRAKASVNGSPAYKIEGQHGLYTKSGLIRFFDI